MLKTWRCLAAICVGVSAPTPRLAAQAMPGPPTQFFSDSTLWQRIVTHVVGSLTTYLVRAGTDPNAQPWQLSIPLDAPQRDFLLGQLRTILRARPTAPSDSLTFMLIIEQPIVSDDTARLTVRTSFGKRCNAGTAMGGFSNIDKVLVPRHPRTGWGAARSTGVVHGDRAGCPGPW